MPRPLKGRYADFAGRSESAVAQTLVFPSRLLLLFIIAFPACVALYIGFTEWNPTSGDLWFRAYRSWEWFDKY